MSCNETCSDPCGKPADYKCDFGISVNPFDESIWNVTICGATTRVKIPKLNETDTHLRADFGSKSLVYDAERHRDVITGRQLGELIELDDLRDVDTADADNCDLLVYNPGCTECGDGCKPKDAGWTKYHIPDAGDCKIDIDEDGYAKVLIKDECGCIRECRLPMIANTSATIDYIRDSVPDDPDYPWYYGAYNDKINLYLQNNCPEFFGKFDLEVTVNYGIQVVHSTNSPNTNFRSLVVPVVEGTDANVAKQSSILQNQSSVSFKNEPYIPWGTVSMRSSFTFIVPKGKEAYLHHEFRLRTKESTVHYATNALDGQKVPDNIAGQIDKMAYTGSRLNALQIVVKPTKGKQNFEPKVDTNREKLDTAVDKYPNIGS